MDKPTLSPSVNAGTNDLPAKRDIFALNALFYIVDLSPPEKDKEKEHKFQRLLWAVPDTEQLVMIDVPTTSPPFWITRSALLYELDEGNLVLQMQDPFAPPSVQEEDLTEKERNIRDRRWALIEPLVTDAKRRIFYPEHSGALIAEASRAGKTCRTNMHKFLRLYWQGGQVPNALLPAFHRCGGRGKPKTIDEDKRGRPSKLALVDATRIGINITKEQAVKLVAGGRKFIEKMGLSQKAAHRETIRVYFSEGLEWQDGKLVAILPEAHLLPTFDQFIYHYGKVRSNTDAVRIRVGSRRFNLQHRPVLGSSTDNTFGPGSEYQVDATVGDLYLLSRILKGRVIGRPVIYLVIDSFSRMVVGIHVGLEGPSWLGMMLALENAFTGKVDFCRRFGRDITEDEWPCHHFPETLLGDRGELISKHADQLVKAFGIRVPNTASWRPDWKPIVERSFRTLNDEVIDWQPGAVHEVRERGEPDYRLDATLTLEDFTEMLIVLILHYNHNHSIQEDMLPLGFPYPEHGNPTPIELWNWGIEHRSGYLRMADRTRVRANLLPAKEVSVTSRGLNYHGQHYAPLSLLENYGDEDPDAAHFENWFLRKLGRKTRKVELAVDPRDVSFAYIRLERGRVLVPCGLLRGDRRFAGMSFQEVMDARAVKAISNQVNQTEVLRDWAAFRAEVEAIEERACKQRDDALGSANTPANVKNIRETRSVERRELQREGVWYLGDVPHTDDAPDAAENPDHQAPSSASGSDGQQGGYVPPPSNLDLLTAARARKQEEEAS